AGGGELIGARIVPDSGVYVARALAGGAVAAWVRQPDNADPAQSRALPAPRAFAAVAVATRYNSHFTGSALYVIGGVDSAGRAQPSVLAADVTPDGVAAATLRLASSDTAPVSLVSGFFAGSWASGATLIPAPRSQFATLDLGEVVLLVGGMYGGAAANAAETIAAAVVGDSLGPFT